MIMKIMSKDENGNPVTHLLDNVTELSYRRRKVGELREEFKKYQNTQVSWYTDGKETDETQVLVFFITRNFNFNRNTGRDYRFEYHVIFDIVYILNDEGKTIDKMWI